MTTQGKLLMFLVLCGALTLPCSAREQEPQVVEAVLPQPAVQLVLPDGRRQPAQDLNISMPASIPYVPPEELPGRFRPLEISLPQELQQFTWELCGTYETPLSQEEFYDIVLRVMWNESRYQVGVRDNVNANGTRDTGLMQINSCNWGWLSEYGLDVRDTYDNIECGVLMLSQLLQKYPVEHALTAYCNGEAGARRMGGTSAFSHRLLNLTEHTQPVPL